MGHPMSPQVTMKASSRSEGTFPAESSWRWIPIPDTTQITGGWDRVMRPETFILLYIIILYIIILYIIILYIMHYILYIIIYCYNMVGSSLNSTKTPRCSHWDDFFWCFFNELFWGMCFFFSWAKRWRDGFSRSVTPLCPAIQKLEQDRNYQNYHILAACQLDL